MNGFDKTTRWIWKRGPVMADEYAEFMAEFNGDISNKTVLRIACDGIYCAFLNDEIVAFSKCADYPHYKLYDLIDITNKLKVGKNILRVCVWHCGEDSSTYVNDLAGVIFEVEKNGVIICNSTEKTLSRQMNEYKNGYLKNITVQLGNSFCFDNTKEKSEYSASVEVEKSPTVYIRQTKPLQIKERVENRIVAKYDNSIIFDMGRETVGFLDLDLESSDVQKITIVYGEHLTDKHVRRFIDKRDFSVEFIAKKGLNKYVNYFRRLAGRYLEIYFEKPIKSNYVGLKEVYYEHKEIIRRFNEQKVQKIYDVCVHTLKCCSFEHYEDCPWREQALYALDGRQQMLSGYYAFEGYDYQRANLVLMSKGLTPKGLVSLCFPCGAKRTIPSFSLFYILAICDYIEHSGDYSILVQVKDAVEKVFGTYFNRIDDSGLVSEFEPPEWNFYEWNKISNGLYNTSEKTYSLILNTLLVLVAEKYKKYAKLKYSTDKLKENIIKTFKLKDGTFKYSTTQCERSVLGNALVILCGLGNHALADKIVNDDSMIQATLAMRSFVYDALLSFGNEYKDYVLNDIKDRYGKMLYDGATTFYETEEGNTAFGGAGSLCHGWSALPVYYFSKLL